jgi:preprotein translocase subunit SecF
VPKDGLKQLPPVCTTLANEKPVKVVYGPGTFVNTAAGEILDGLNARKNAKAKDAQQAAAAARELARKKGYSKARQEKFASQASSLVYAQFARDLLQLALKYGFSGLPSLDNVDFVDNLVFDSSRAPARRRHASRTCSRTARRADPGAASSRDSETRSAADAIRLIERATNDQKFKPKYGATLRRQRCPRWSPTHSANEVQNATIVLLIAALVIMAITLALVFRTRMRLLPLAPRARRRRD